MERARSWSSIDNLRLRSPIETQLDEIAVDARIVVDDLRRSPTLAPYLIGDSGLPGSFSLFRRIQQVLQRNPDLLDELNRVADAHPDHVALLVAPDVSEGQPLILSRYGNTTSAVVPILGCTRMAMKDTWGNKRPQEGYDLFLSDNGLMEDAWEMAEATDGDGIMTYHRTKMSPEDYVGLACKEYFTMNLLD
ncbi:MAG: hypothetical protein HYV40_00130 [Candidatus Levybacteria bacterium]|nr:hypothetical protein [Candidatus Levybacteria bacterium]